MSSSEPRPKGRYRTSIVIQEFENGTYRATQQGLDVSGTGDTHFEAVRELLSECERMHYQER